MNEIAVIYGAGFGTVIIDIERLKDEANFALSLV